MLGILFLGFYFFRILTDLESDELVYLVTLLDSVQLCSSSDKFIWTSDLIGIFSSSTFFFLVRARPFMICFVVPSPFALASYRKSRSLPKSGLLLTNIKH